MCLPKGSLPRSHYSYSIPRRCSFIRVNPLSSLPSNHKLPFLWLFQTIHLNYLEKHRQGIVISVDQNFCWWEQIRCKLARCKTDKLGTTYSVYRVEAPPKIPALLVQQEKPPYMLIEKFFQVSKVGDYFKIFKNSLWTKPRIPVMNGPPFWNPLPWSSKCTSMLKKKKNTLWKILPSNPRIKK